MYGAMYAGLSGTAPVSMVVLHVWYFGLRVHSGKIAGKFYVRPLFLIFGFFCVVETLLFGGEVCLFGISGLVEPDILVLVLLVLLLRSLMLVGGSRMGIWSWIRRFIFGLLCGASVDPCWSA